MIAADEIRRKVDAAIEAAQDDGLRHHLGPSRLSSPCNRAVWYDYRWYTYRHLNARILRIFERGVAEEAVIVRRLRDAGFSVSDVDEEGKQHNFATFDGHFRGSADGIIEVDGESGLLEIKTMNTRKFRKLIRDGQIPLSHFDQMQCYMHYLDLRWGLHVAVCKDNDEWHFTKVNYDERQARNVIDRAYNILRAKRPPRRISETGTYYICKMCEHSLVCHRGEEPQMNCRTCAASNLGPNSEWRCSALEHRPIDMGLRDGNRIRMLCEGHEWRGIAGD